MKPILESELPNAKRNITNNIIVRCDTLETAKTTNDITEMISFHPTPTNPPPYSNNYNNTLSFYS